MHHENSHDAFSLLLLKTILLFRFVFLAFFNHFTSHTTLHSASPLPNIPSPLTPFIMELA